MRILRPILLLLVLSLILIALLLPATSCNGGPPTRVWDEIASSYTSWIGRILDFITLLAPLFLILFWGKAWLRRPIVLLSLGLITFAGLIHLEFILTFLMCFLVTRTAEGDFHSGYYLSLGTAGSGCLVSWALFVKSWIDKRKKR